MPVTLDVITRKKLILVRQIYQRALLQAEAQHSYVDRILSLIGFDLSNETLMKAVVGALDPRQTPSNDFQGVLQQAERLLVAANLPVPSHKAQIQHVRALRNDAQHKAKYPNDTDLNDCRTYTRDFLKQTILDVWAGVSQRLRRYWVGLANAFGVIGLGLANAFGVIRTLVQFRLCNTPLLLCGREDTSPCGSPNRLSNCLGSTTEALLC